MITSKCVSKDIAKLLKEKGYDEPTLTHYIIPNTVVTYNAEYKSFRNSELNNAYNAPNYIDITNWFMNKHNIFIQVTFSHSQSSGKGFKCMVWDLNNEPKKYYPAGVKCFNSFDEAIETGIRYCLEILLDKKDE